MASDGIKWSPVARVLKYDPDTVQDIVRLIGHEPTGAELRHLEATQGLTPDSIVEAEGNLLTTAGLNAITALIIGSAATSFTNAHSIVGVGASTTTATVADTALGGNGGSAWYQAADASNPTQANGVLTCNSTFGTSAANFAWQEWCWAGATTVSAASATLNLIGTAGLVMYNHKVQSLGTKSSGSTWTLQATVTLS